MRNAIKDNAPSTTILPQPEDIPPAYLKRRKRTAILFILTMYAFATACALFNLGVLNGSNNGRLGILVPLGLAVIVTMVFARDTARHHQGLPISEHRAIKVFERWEIILYLLPVPVLLWLAPLETCLMGCALGTLYVNYSRVRDTKVGDHPSMNK